MSITRLKRDWDELGETDPLWAILSDPRRRFGKWDVGEFFRTGEREIAQLMEHASRLGYPRRRNRALDFGCGVGRLTAALSKYFAACYGVDIARSMIEQARKLNSSAPNCTFIENARADLRIFESGYFDLVYTNIVLQHLPSRSMVRGYLRELFRVLDHDGLLVFQLLTSVPLLYRIQPRKRLYAVLRSLGLGRSLLLERLRLAPIPLNVFPENELLELLASIDARLLDVRADPNSPPPIQSRIYYVTRR